MTDGLGHDGGVTDVRTPTNPFVEPIRPITATDDEIRAALERGRGTGPAARDGLPHRGPGSLLRDDLRPEALLLGMPQGGLTEDQQGEVRRIALETLVRFRDAGSHPAPPPSDEDLLRIMEFAVGGAEMAEYLPLARGGARVPR